MRHKALPTTDSGHLQHNPGLEARTSRRVCRRCSRADGREIFRPGTPGGPPSPAVVGRLGSPEGRRGPLPRAGRRYRPDDPGEPGARPGQGALRRRSQGRRDPVQRDGSDGARNLRGTVVSPRQFCTACLTELPVRGLRDVRSRKGIGKQRGFQHGRTDVSHMTCNARELWSYLPTPWTHNKNWLASFPVHHAYRCDEICVV